MHGQRVICTDIKSDFSHLDLSNLISLATKNQVVYLEEIGSSINYDNVDDIQKYIQNRGFNFKEVEEVVYLAHGAESNVLRMKVKQPVEVIAKMILPSMGSS